MDLKSYVVVHSDHDADLGGFRIFTLQKVLSNNQSSAVTWELKAVDVPAEANSGLFMLNIIAGRGVFSGVVEMDKKRILTISQDCIVPSKSSQPMVYDVFAPNYDSLPMGWKSHGELAEVLRLYYNRKEYLSKVRKFIDSRNLSDSEQRELMDSSFARANEVFVETAKKMKELVDNPVPPPVQKPQNDMGVPMS